MKWVLLWVVISGRGVTNDSVEFETRAACQHAAEVATQMKTLYETIKGVCVAKGERP